MTVYFCPTSGEIEDSDLGGFDTCCDRKDLHHPPTAAEWADHELDLQLLARVATDTGERTDLDDVITELGFTRAELEEEP